jgi:hypothetical protein
MKASKFSDAQKAFMAGKANDGAPVADIVEIRRLPRIVLPLSG